MSDEARNYLTSEMEALQAAVFKGGALNAKTLGPTAERHLENALPLVTVSPALEEATYHAVARIAQFARLLYGQAAIAEIEEARRSTLKAVDALGAVMLASLRPQTARTERTDEAALPLPLGG